MKQWSVKHNFSDYYVIAWVDKDIPRVLSL